LRFTIGYSRGFVTKFVKAEKINPPTAELDFTSILSKTRSAKNQNFKQLKMPCWKAKLKVVFDKELNAGVIFSKQMQKST
jgi:hypothetical protein